MVKIEIKNFRWDNGEMIIWTGDHFREDYIKRVNEMEIKLKDIILNETKIKEPITKGKLKWHGIKKFSQTSSNLWWLEQKGKIIGKKHTF